MTGDDVAQVEKAVTVLGIETLCSGYRRTGMRWMASHRDGQVTWVRES